MADEDVVIVGGGPNGLMTAIELALGGVRPLVLERLPEPATLPKANGLVGRVVQAMDYRGLYERFSGEPGPPTPAPYFSFGALTLDMAGWDGNALYTLPIPQRRIEELLERRASELGVRIRRGHEVTGLGQDAGGVTVDVRGPQGGYELCARFLVGADGGHSTVRKLAGIGFPGVTEERFAGHTGQALIDAPVAVPGGHGDLDVPGVGRLRPASFLRTERGCFAHAMFRPGVYSVAAFEWDRPPAAEATFQDLRAAVCRVLGAEIPMSEPPAEQGGASVRVHAGINSRLAARYRAGRMFLVGDAAHVQSSVGGPGLNLGLQDALNLGWKLAATVRGWAPEDLLSTYESERRPVAERVIMHSRAQTALLSPGPDITALREVFGELLREPGNVRHISDLMSGADTRYPAGYAPAHALAGGWMPDLPLAGRATRVAELLRTARPLLLDLAGRPESVAAGAEWGERVAVATAYAEDRPADAVLIRPDGYVAWAATGRPDPDGLRLALRTWFGDPPAPVA
ncbi:2-polyprenyl-6-methoxyphenol hydroxylase-like FAD-dependent oxidoreductase [Thermocatellispora tengchongensis]|uniref:2-polyprenyl-6-methoxyphenol hydroxylase-like FAD-dependent oxidoreductase n=1 Tax=Thermocatellispora tengchongensis TaxID=1073253 RepID=A0A840PAX3_9ACTN|nr:FAD-dependent monooxygenase [Thermocatellispora tengchongensis]MBB5138544.1 2-polyprenyl-6-methoxyphenol hydroxylase-like FAD-dependent oxidoreductase [Thermocatellispora tengchongensis]